MVERYDMGSRAKKAPRAVPLPLVAASAQLIGQFAKRNTEV
jgi:hypothetical protein